MKTLFLDTNIYLMFYHYSKDDLEELRKLLVAIEKGRICLIITPQLKDEFYRNRELKISDAIEIFQRTSLPKEFPVCFKQEELLYENIRNAVKNFNSARENLISKVVDNFKNNNLEADGVITNLFKKATIYEEDIKTFPLASERFFRGRPPGKKDSKGDAIIWETLLKGAKKEKVQELHLISYDGDYESKLQKGFLKKYLYDEWKEKTGGEIFLHKTLSHFLNNEFPDIKFATDLEKTLAIENLVNCYSFRDAHQAISVLNGYRDNLEEDEVIRIINAGLNNDQIYSIHADSDVREFFKKLGEENMELIPEGRKNKFKRLYIDEEDLDLSFAELYEDN